MEYSDTNFSGFQADSANRKSLHSNLEHCRRLISDGKYIANKPFIEEVIEQCIESHRYHSSLKLIAELLQAFPQDAVLWSQRALCYSRIYLPKHAGKAYQTALSFNPSDITVVLPAVDFYISADRRAEAVKLLEDAENIFPFDANTSYRVGRIWQRYSAFEKALEWFSRVTAEDNIFADVLFQTALVYEALNDFDNALLAYDKYLYEEPGCVTGWFNRGVLLERFKKYDEAAESYSFALMLKEDFIEALFNLGNIYADRGKYDDSIECFEKVICLQPKDHAAYYNLGLLYQEMQEHEWATNYFSRAIAIEPEIPENFLSRGFSRLKSENLDSALEDFRSALILEMPELSKYKLDDLLVSLDTERIKEEISLLETEAKSNPAVLTTLIEKFLILRNYNGALAAINLYSRSDIPDSLGLILQAIVYFSMGNTLLGYANLSQALAAGEKALKIFKEIFPLTANSKLFNSLFLITRKSG